MNCSGCGIFELTKKYLSAHRWLILVLVSLYSVHLAIFHFFGIQNRSSLFQSACGPCSDCSGCPSLLFTLPVILSSTEPPVWKLKKENIEKAEDNVFIIFTLYDVLHLKVRQLIHWTSVFWYQAAAVEGSGIFCPFWDWSNLFYFHFFLFSTFQQ